MKLDSAYYLYVYYFIINIKNLQYSFYFDTILKILQYVKLALKPYIGQQKNEPKGFVFILLIIIHSDLLDILFQNSIYRLARLDCMHILKIFPSISSL